jgi:hypothetical protein
MDHLKRIILLLLVMMGVLLPVQSQEPDTTNQPRTFSVSLDFRPRTEYRNGYRQLMSDSSEAAFFTEQRSRLNLKYEAKDFIFYTSLQDIFVWGEHDPTSTSGTTSLFEAYVEPSLGAYWSVRMGRQRIMYDNQRLFAENDWRQAAGSHDAIRFLYKRDHLEADFIGAYNQPAGAQEKFSGRAYEPGFNRYKILAVSFLQYQPDGPVTLKMINAMDAFQQADTSGVVNYRFTSGGRIEYDQAKWYLTCAAYYQYGETPAGTPLSAFYVQPEIKYLMSSKWFFRLGAEVFSGDDGTRPSNTSHSFDALYGVNHRFLGSMDYFTKFPKDFNNAGIMAPYFFTFYNLNQQLTLRSDEHLFYSQNNFVADGAVINPYLGFEHDLLAIWKPNKFTELQLGYSYFLTTESMEAIKPGGDSSIWQDWAYLSISFKPELLRLNF